MSNINSINGINFRIASNEEILNSTKLKTDYSINSHLINCLMKMIKYDCDKRRENRGQIFEKIYSLEDIHKYRPKIYNYDSNKSEKYIRMIMYLCNYSKEETIKFLKTYNGDIYSVIVFS